MYMRRSKVISALLLIGIIAVFITAFLFLDFKAAISGTKFESAVINTSSTAPVNLSGGLYVYMMEDDDLTQELRYSLINNLSEKWSGILEANSLEKNYDRQVLIVNLRNREISYNPFYPSARVETIFYYSPSGDTINFKAFKDGWPHYSYFEKNETVLVGRLNLTDTTIGVVSLKAYRKYLAEEIAKNIIQKLPSQ